MKSASSFTASSRSLPTPYLWFYGLCFSAGFYFSLAYLCCLSLTLIPISLSKSHSFQAPSRQSSAACKRSSVRTSCSSCINFMVRDSTRDLSYRWLKIWHDIYHITSAIFYEWRTQLHHCLLSKMTMEVRLEPRPKRGAYCFMSVGY
jgi:hypothetical protein